MGAVVKYKLAPSINVARPLKLANPLASALQSATIEGRPPDVTFGAWMAIPGCN